MTLEPIVDQQTFPSKFYTECDRVGCIFVRNGEIQHLQSFSEKVHEVARASLDEVVDGFLRSNGIVVDQRMTFMERTSLRAECRRLTKFLRLIDFVVVDALRDLVRF